MDGPLAHYPPSENEGLGISDHTDWELFTLLYPNFYPMQQNVPCHNGLEVWYKEKWVAVPHLPGTIIVNQGEMMSRFRDIHILHQQFLKIFGPLPLCYNLEYIPQPRKMVLDFLAIFVKCIF